MKKVNKVLILFVLIAGASLIAGWQFIQSERFASFLSERISEYLAEVQGLEVRFDKIKVGIIPVRTTLKNARVQYDDYLEVSADEVSFGFSIVSFFQTTPQISIIKIQNSEIRVLKSLEKLLPQSLEDDKKKDSGMMSSRDVKKYIDESVNDIISQLPISVQQVVFVNTGLEFDDASLMINQLSVINQDELGFFLEVTNPQVGFDIPVNVNVIDALSIALVKNEGHIIVDGLKMHSGLNRLSAEGNLASDGKIVFSAEFQGDQSFLTNFVTNENLKILKHQEGFVEINVKGNYDDIEGASIQFKSSAHNINKEFLPFDQVRGEGEYRRDIIEFGLLQIKVKDSIAEATGVVDLSKEKDLYAEGRVRLEDVDLADILPLDTLPGVNLEAALTGEVKLYYQERQAIINIKENFGIKSFKIAGDGTNESIISIDSAILDEGLLVISDDIFFDIGVVTQNSFLPIIGSIQGEKIEISATQSIIELDDFNLVSSGMFRGRGQLDIAARGSLPEVTLYVTGNISESEIIELKLGQLELDMNIDFNNDKIVINKASSHYQESLLEGRGEILLGDNSQINLDIEVVRSNYADAIKILESLIEDVQLPSAGIEYYFEGEVFLRGGLAPGELIVRSRFHGEDLILFEEEFNSFSFHLLVENDILTFDQVVLKKSTSEGLGRLVIDPLNNHLEYNFTLSPIPLRDVYLYSRFGLGLDGEMAIVAMGSGRPEHLQSQINVEVESANVADVQMGKTNASIHVNGSDIEIDFSFFNKMITGQSLLALENLQGQSSFLEFKVQTSSIEKLLGVFSDHNLKDSSLVGEIDLSSRAEFSFHDFQDINIDFLLNKLSIQNDSFKVFTDGPQVVVIESGKVKQWDVLMKGSGDSIIRSHGQGDVKQSLYVRNQVDLSAGILSILSDKIIRPNGRILLETIFQGGPEQRDHLTRIFVDRLAMRIDGVPGEITNGIIDITIDGHNAYIQNFVLRYGQGYVRAMGSTEIKFPFPRLDIRWAIENATIPILRRSQINISGSGDLSGDRMPYLVRGMIGISHGQIFDNLDDFAPKQSRIGNYLRFLPMRQDRGFYGPIELDLMVDVERPITLRNSLAEMFISGDVRISGTPSDPLLNGEINTVAQRSRFKFKGYDFILSEGRVRFDDGEFSRPPYINFVGNSQINQYRVSIEVGGRTDNISISMTSDPPLAQDDILSLLTLGFTRSISRDLDEAERQQVTTVGLGALLFDQFQITEGLTSGLGLRFSISPEFSENEAALIQGRSGVADTSSSRVRSATRLRVQRQLSDRIDLSVSSTIGGSMEQRQEMNLNYQINERFSIEGVYEMRSTEENITNTPDSIGADLKWRWSF